MATKYVCDKCGDEFGFSGDLVKGEVEEGSYTLRFDLCRTCLEDLRKVWLNNV